MLPPMHIEFGSLIAWILVLATCGMPIAAAALSLVRFIRQNRGRGKAPVNDRLLRPPGHTLRIKLDRFDEKFTAAVVQLLLISATLLVLLWVIPRIVQGSPARLLSFAGALALSAGISWYIARRVRAALVQGRNDTLGYRGELCAGQELNELMRNGCFVFHDVPGDGAWNIDHVVVAPSGVFAVETKTRSKPVNVEGRKNYEVWYDGKELEFPTWKDRHGLEQAEQNARWLSKFLSGAMAETIKAVPVLVLPGWFVSRRPNTPMNAVLVLSLNGARKYLLDYRGPSLTERQMSQIAHHLEQRCRDVEF